MKIKLRSYFSVLLPLLASCDSSPIRQTPGTTYGKILISSPTVDTRERLINDRMDQYVWLAGQLKAADNASFSANGSRSLRSARQFGANISANVDPSATAFNQVAEAARLAELKNQQTLADLDFQIAEAQRKLILKDAKEATDASKITLPGKTAIDTSAAKSPVPDKTTFADLQSASTAQKSMTEAMVAALAPSSGGAAPTPIEQFRDHLALREEIRNEMIANSLDDRHDLRGNALYRMSFDATVLPADDTSAYAVVSVCVQRPGTRRCDQRGTAANGHFSDEDAFALHRAIKRYFTEGVATINDDFDLHSDAFTKTGDITLLNSRTQKLYAKGLDVMSEIAKRPPAKTLNKNSKINLGDFTDSLKSYAVNVRQASLSKKPAPLASTLASQAGGSQTVRITDFLCELAAGAAAATMDLPDRVVGTDASLLNAACEKTGAAKVAAVRQTIAIYGLAISIKERLYQANKSLRSESEFFSQHLVDNGKHAILLQGARLELNLKLVPLVKDGLKRDKLEIYAYGATPKESVQRISDVVTRREGLQLAMGLQALAGNTGLSALTNFMQVNEGVFNALKRQPLVVGFGHSSAQIESTINGDVPPSDFGWIIGPRFGTARDGKSANFRQTVVQNGLSAVVSVPGWWDSAELVVRRYWVTESGAVLGVHAEQSAVQFDRANDYNSGEIIKYAISLPDSVDDVLNILNSGQAIELEEERGDAPSWDLKYGARAEVLIRGKNLWRNPQVRLGSQFADRVHVMPDMSGVVAIFANVDSKNLGANLRPLGKVTPPDSLPVTIATPNGYELVGFARVTEDKPPSAKLRADGGQVLIGGETNSLALNLPLTGYYALGGVYRQAGSGAAFAPDKAQIGRKKSQLLSYKPPALANAVKGKAVELQLLLTRNKGEEPERVPVDGAMIYYPAKKDWAVAVATTAGQDELRHSYSLELTFPPGYEDALQIKDGKAGFNVVGAGINDVASCVIVKDKCNIALTLAPPLEIDKVGLKPQGLGEATPNPFGPTLPAPVAPRKGKAK